MQMVKNISRSPAVTRWLDSYRVMEVSLRCFEKNILHCALSCNYRISSKSVSTGIIEQKLSL